MVYLDGVLDKHLGLFSCLILKSPTINISVRSRMYTCECIYVYIFLCVYIYIFTEIYVCIYTYVIMCIYKHINIFHIDLRINHNVLS